VATKDKISKRQSRDMTEDLDDTLKKGVSRRGLLGGGAAAGVAVAVGAGSAPAAAQEAGDGMTWDYEVDVIVVGGGCTGLPAAIRALDLGSSVMIVDQNYDLGGRLIHSGGQTSLGGGDPLQLRDIAGESDPEGFLTVQTAHTVEELTEDPDHLFRDMTDWSIVDGAAQAPYRYNERDLHRAWADNCYDARQFMMDNYLRFGRIAGTHGTGGMTRARRAVPYLMLGETTDIRAGTIAYEDAARDRDGNLLERVTAFCPRRLGDGGSVANPNAVTGGGVMARCLEFAAREKGAQIMLNRHMDDLIREEPFAGRVLGIRASYTPRHSGMTGQRLESYWSNGNIDERRPVVTIRARKAVILGPGGHPGNPEVRAMFYPAFRDPVWGTSGQALLGRERGADGSGIVAGLRIGANLSGMQQNLSYATTFHVATRVATPDAYTDMYPGHPTFPFRQSTGFDMNANTMEHAIAVNQVGKRFYNDMDLMRRHSSATFPGGSIAPNGMSGIDIVQGDWRNCSRDFIRGMYQAHAGLHAALAINEGSQAPDFHPGPLWAIFDEAAVERAGLDLRYPFVAENGYFFKADTLEELADKIYAQHEFQRVPMTYLRETVDRWNGFVDAGSDPDFGRGEDAPMHRIDTGPFYAAAIVIVWHDSYGGLRINGKAQVIDMQGQPIPGLYAGGEVSGGGNQHGIGRATVHGYIAGTEAAAEMA
jgi:hypothetical protein